MNGLLSLDEVDGFDSVKPAGTSLAVSNDACAAFSSEADFAVVVGDFEPPPVEEVVPLPAVVPGADVAGLEVAGLEVAGGEVAGAEMAGAAVVEPPAAVVVSVLLQPTDASSTPALSKATAALERTDFLFIPGV